jgi:anti-sigma factor RsiW
LAGEGYPLLGGRVDTLDGHDVAALVYGYRDHRIGVFVRPHAGFDVLPETTVERGFNVVHTRRNRMEWWVVSDLNAPQLREFAASLARDD